MLHSNYFTRASKETETESCGEKRWETPTCPQRQDWNLKTNGKYNHDTYFIIS